MTIAEAIKHCNEVAEDHTKYNLYGGVESCDECAEEHRQLARWLEELQAITDILTEYGLEKENHVDTIRYIFGKFKKIADIIDND